MTYSFVSSLPPHMSDTFVASVRSVGTAVTLASVGVYLHQRGFVVGDGKRTLALLSQQVTFPLFLFTKIVYCNQDWSRETCPNITDSLKDVWMLLLWPLVVVGLGLLVGRLVIHMSGTPPHLRGPCLAACALGNSSGLPITLLTVVHTNFPKTSDLGRMDPTLFLSIYLLLYPVLQWGLGGWLLAPSTTSVAAAVEETDEHGDTGKDCEQQTMVMSSGEAKKQHAVVMATSYHAVNSRRHSKSNNMTSLDEGNYISEMDLTLLAGEGIEHPEQHQPDEDMNDSGAFCVDPAGTTCTEMHTLTPTTRLNQSTISASSTSMQKRRRDSSPLTAEPTLNNMSLPSRQPHATTDLLSAASRYRDERQSLLSADEILENDLYSFDTAHISVFWSTFQNICRRCLQPPVIGSLLGIVVATIQPLRGVFVDLETRSSRAPLQWFFDGLYTVGMTAVPINMMILGCNISASFKSTKPWGNGGCAQDGFLPWKTMVWIVIGKMIVMPFVGISLCYCLKRYFWSLPDDIDAAVYLVMMIVFLTPTANNVMVIVELGLPPGAKEGIAQVIALQYVFAPLLLSITMSVAIGVASNWS